MEIAAANKAIIEYKRGITYAVRLNLTALVIQ